MRAMLRLLLVTLIVCVPLSAQPAWAGAEGSLYEYIKSLGPAGPQAPDDIPPKG